MIFHSPESFTFQGYFCFYMLDDDYSSEIQRVVKYFEFFMVIFSIA